MSSKWYLFLRFLNLIFHYHLLDPNKYVDETFTLDDLDINGNALIDTKADVRSV